MPILTLQRRQVFKVAIPYVVCVNDQPIGLMQSKEVNIEMPDGEYTIGVWIMLGLFKWRLRIGGSTLVKLVDGKQRRLQISDKERWWNILFDIDLVCWLARFFVDIQGPWNMIYEIVSNGFFIVWMARIWFIRERYFTLKEIEE